MSDRERPVPPLRRSYEPGRRNFEQPGQGGFPLELERLTDAQLGITVADVSPMAPGLDRGFETARQFSGAVAAQFAALSLTCPDGLYLEWFRHNAGAATGITVTPAAPAFATLAGTFNRSGFPGLIPRLVAIQGNLGASLGSVFFLPANTPLQIRLWVPPSFWLNIVVDTANVASDNNLILSGTTLA